MTLKDSPHLLSGLFLLLFIYATNYKQLPATYNFSD